MALRPQTIHQGELDMKLVNSTDWPDYMLRRMVSWCCKQIEMPVRTVKECRFRNSKSTWGGVARPWARQISVCVTKNEFEFPAGCSTHEKGEKFADRIECLVAVTAHELYHVAAEKVDEHKQRTRGYGGGMGSSERATCAKEMRVLRLFREQRGVLLAEWMTAPKTQEPKPQLSVKERNHEKAVKMLVRWERKLKLATTKVKALRRKIARYQILPLLIPSQIPSMPLHSSPDPHFSPVTIA